jgi:hypothetical protein
MMIASKVIDTIGLIDERFFFDSRRVGLLPANPRSRVQMRRFGSFAAVAQGVEYLQKHGESDSTLLRRSQSFLASEQTPPGGPKLARIDEDLPEAPALSLLQ